LRGKIPSSGARNQRAVLDHFDRKRGALVAKSDWRLSFRQEWPMSHDDFENERYKVEHVLQILDDAAGRLQLRANVPLVVLHDALEFLAAIEDTSYEAALADEDSPELTACLLQHAAVRRPLAVMHEALASLQLGEASAADRFARAARDYVRLRREHVRIDDRLFASARKAFPKSHAVSAPIEITETAALRRLYYRLVEAAGILDIGGTAATTTARRRAGGP